MGGGLFVVCEEFEMQEYFNVIGAAEYCGYAPETFRRHVRQYPLPRYGPKKNRIKRLDLDVWMEDQNAFKVVSIGSKRKTCREKTLSFEEQKRLVLGASRAA